MELSKVIFCQFDKWFLSLPPKLESNISLFKISCLPSPDLDSGCVEGSGVVVVAPGAVFVVDDDVDDVVVDLVAWCCSWMRKNP